jgi:hypothetical protein
MPEIWEHPFGNAQLKVERAKKHITDLEERIRTSSDAYPPSLKIDGNTGEQFLYYALTDRTFKREIALICGDAIHNLRCALDFAWCGVIKQFSPTALTRHTQFPVPDCRQKLIGDITKTGKISPTSPVYDFMVERVKSHKGGDADICAIHALDIDDKHMLLIPVVNFVRIDGVELEDEGGAIMHSIIATDRNIGYRVRIPPGSHVKNHGHATIQVVFPSETAAEGLEVISTLWTFYGKTREIVRKLQRMTSDARRQNGLR